MERLKYSLGIALVLTLSCAQLSDIARTSDNTEITDSKASVTFMASGSLHDLAVWIISGGDTTFASGVEKGIAVTCRADRAKIFAACQVIGSAADDLAGEASGIPWPDASVPPRLDTVSADLNAMTSDRICCTGTMEKQLAPGQNDIELFMQRSICKLELGKVENRLSEGAYTGQTIILEKVFIINGVGRQRLFGGGGSGFFKPVSGRWWFRPSGLGTDTEWGNNLQVDASRIVAADEGYTEAPLLSISTPDVQIPYGKTETLNIELFTGPNNVTEDSWWNGQTDMFHGQWTPRKTRLVLQCLIGGLRCFFPLTFDNLEANYIYSVKRLIITRFGTESPDLPFDFGNEGASISIQKWDVMGISEII